MLNYLGRFCTRIKRELFYEKLISKDLIGSNGCNIYIPVCSTPGALQTFKKEKWITQQIFLPQCHRFTVRYNAGQPLTSPLQRMTVQAPPTLPNNLTIWRFPRIPHQRWKEICLKIRSAQIRKEVIYTNQKNPRRPPWKKPQLPLSRSRMILVRPTTNNKSIPSPATAIFGSK